MTKYISPVQTNLNKPFLPYWARSPIQHAQNLLPCTNEPVEYDHDDEDYRDNCFFFPEDCSWSPPEGWVVEENISISSGSCDSEHRGRDEEDDDNTMIPGLPDVKMLDSEALSDLLEDNLSPPEITSILVFATNGALFAHASPLPPRILRNLSTTYGAAYTTHAKTASTGNLTGVNPASHPSSYVTAHSVSLAMGGGDVGSIVFELDGLVAVVTRVADKVLLAAVGPSRLGVGVGVGAEMCGSGSGHGYERGVLEEGRDLAGRTVSAGGREHEHESGNADSPRDNPHSMTPADQQQQQQRQQEEEEENQNQGQNQENNLETQYEIDRSADLARLASLNLPASPSILLALESKSAALGRFLGVKLADLECPEDF